MLQLGRFRSFPEAFEDHSLDLPNPNNSTPSPFHCATPHSVILCFFSELRQNVCEAKNIIVILRCNKKEMGITKSELFSDVQNELAIAAKAFAHPARIAIVQYLLKTNTCINSDLVQELGLAQATISQHLRELKEIGIIQGTIEGVSVCYCIDPSKWAEILGLFHSLFDQYSDPSTNCC